METPLDPPLLGHLSSFVPRPYHVLFLTYVTFQLPGEMTEGLVQLLTARWTHLQCVWTRFQ